VSFFCHGLCALRCSLILTLVLPFSTPFISLFQASHAYDHLWSTEWPRIREVETERYLMDMHGMFYELSPLVWGGALFGVKPISQHLRMVPDFASFRGFLVLGGNQVSSIFDHNVVTGQAQAGLWFGKTDDLWGFGKPQGWGGPWMMDDVNIGEASDPYLMVSTFFPFFPFFLFLRKHRQTILPLPHFNPLSLSPSSPLTVRRALTRSLYISERRAVHLK